MTLLEAMNSQFSLIQNLDFCARILLASICGACIGFERSRRFKEAGIRTHIIVCCGAALVMIVSKYGFADLADPAGHLFNGTRGADAARMAAQVVSGISFVGAGVIYKNGSAIKGLTTAAGLWTTAAIGLAVGAGMIVLGVFVTVLVAIFQIIMHKFTVGADSYSTYQLRFSAEDTEEFRRSLEKQLGNWKAQVADTEISRAPDGLVDYKLTLRMSSGIGVEQLQEFLDTNKEVSRLRGFTVSWRGTL